MCFKWVQTPRSWERREETETECFLGVGLRDLWKVYREEVALELRLKLQAEQKASAPNQTADSHAKSGFCLEML